jgi:hypothetical protein
MDSYFFRMSVLVFAFQISSTLLSANAQQTPVESIEKVKRSLVQAVCILQNDTNQDEKVDQEVHVLGTGFFVAKDGSFVTSKHVYEPHLYSNRKLPSGCMLGVRIVIVTHEGKRGNHFDFRRKVCLSVENNVDMTLCRTAENPFSKPELLPYIEAAELHETGFGSDGTRVYVSGFPQFLSTPMTDTGIIAARVKLSDILDPFEGPKDYDLVVTSMISRPGMSGSPVYDASGKVLGVVRGNVQDKMGNTLGFLTYYPISSLPSIKQIPGNW